MTEITSEATKLYNACLIVWGAKPRNSFYLSRAKSWLRQDCTVFHTSSISKVWPTPPDTCLYSTPLIIKTGWSGGNNLIDCLSTGTMGTRKVGLININNCY